MAGRRTHVSASHALTHYAAVGEFEVRRNATFERLGMMNSRRSHTLIPYYDATYRKEFLSNPHVVAVLTHEALVDTVPDQYGVAVCADPMASFLRLHAALAADDDYVGVTFKTEIGPGARIHDRAYVSESGVVIGRNVVIEPHATILAGTVIGDDVVVQAGAILGSDGHETRERDGDLFQLPHIGRTIIGDRVVVGYQSMVDRALFLEETVVGESTKIGSLSILAHGSQIGQRCRIRSRVTVAGATVVGNDVVMGPSATISNGLTIGDKAIVTIGELVTVDVPAGMVAVGRKLVSRERFLIVRKLLDAHRRAPSRPPDAD